MPEPIATFPPSADVLQKALGEETSRYTPHMEAVQVFNREARPIYFVSMRMTTNYIANFDGLPVVLILAGSTMNRSVADRVAESRKPGDPAEAPAR